MKKLLSLLLCVLLVFTLGVAAFAETTEPPVHQHVWGEEIVLREATCARVGYARHQCTVCNVWENYELEKAPHGETRTDYGKYTVCTYTGDKVCTVCGEIVEKGKVKETVEHTPDPEKDEVVAPTCSADGYTRRVCAVCGESYRDTIVKTRGHIDEDKDAVCDRCHKDIAIAGAPSDVCKLCGRVHNLDLWDRLVGGAHAIQYFFTQLFTKISNGFNTLG